MRIVKVPYRKINWFNKRLRVEKNWNGTFGSKLGYGHCMSGTRNDEQYCILYAFEDLNGAEPDWKAIQEQAKEVA